MLVDSHCHLDFPEFEPELDEVVARARRAGVGAMLTICTRLSKFAPVRAVAERYQGIWCSLGVHPHEAEEEGVGDMRRLVDMAADPLVVALGETGLDYYYDHSPRAKQRRSFEAHIEACRETGLPLIVHTRDADEDTAAMLREGAADGRLRGVMHCFSSGRDLAEEAVALGFHISVSGIATFKKAEELRDTIRGVPLDRLLVETDAPYLAPVPMRGRRNEPAYVVHTAAVVAGLKGVAPDNLARATTDNFFALFDRCRREDAAPCG